MITVAINLLAVYSIRKNSVCTTSEEAFFEKVINVGHFNSYEIFLKGLLR